MAVLRQLFNGGVQVFSVLVSGLFVVLIAIGIVNKSIVKSERSE